MNQLPDFEAIDYDTQTLQALAFMTGFAVNQFYKRSNKYPICLDYLTTDKEWHDQSAQSFQIRIFGNCGQRIT